MLRLRVSDDGYRSRPRRLAEDSARSGASVLTWIVPGEPSEIPGTKRVSRVEEKPAADEIELSVEQIERLDNLAPATDEHHEEGNMAVIDR
jgi:diketogulonate reductase-like aldo/keto reductase